MGNVVFHAVFRKLAAYCFIAATGAVALGVASLNHKALYYAVEGKPIVKAAFCKLHKVFNGYRGGVAVKHKLYIAVILNCYNCVVGAVAAAGIAVKLTLPF